MDHYNYQRVVFGKLIERLFDHFLAFHNVSLQRLLVDDGGYCEQPATRETFHLLMTQHHFCPHQNMIFVVGLGDSVSVGDCQCADGKHCAEYQVVCESLAMGILKVVCMLLLSILIIIWLYNKYARIHQD